MNAVPDTAAFIREIRLYELQRLRRFFPAAGRILEIGVGNGWQARALQEMGYMVSGVDVPGSLQARDSVFPFDLYDGRRLPFADRSFDAVFSSSVMEHVQDFPALQREIHRVLRPGGVVIHVVPDACWRFWTTLAHFIQVARFPGRFRHAPWPRCHGERGNVLTELYFFSRFHWRRLFCRAGWTIRHCLSNRLFYTGYSLCGARLTLSRRAALSRLLGGVCLIFVLTPASFQP